MTDPLTDSFEIVWNDSYKFSDDLKSIAHQIVTATVAAHFLYILGPDDEATASDQARAIDAAIALKKAKKAKE